MDLDTHLTVPPQVMSRLVGDETVLLDLASGNYFGLDSVGKSVWEAISAGRSLAEAVGLIIAEYDVDEAQARSDVLTFAEDLVESGLLTRLVSE